MTEKRRFVFFYFLSYVLLCNPVHGISGAFFADNGREQSILYKTLAKKDRILLQEEILNLLGLENRPKKRQVDKHRKRHSKTHASSAELFLLNLYTVLGDGGDNHASICDNSETCVRPLEDSDFIISFENKVHNHEFPYLKSACDRRFYFNVTQMPPAEEIVKAELRIFRNITKRSERSRRYNYNLFLYAVSDINNDRLELVDEQLVTGADDGKWLVMNVTIPLMKWIAYPEENYGLYLKIRSETKYKGRAHNIQPFEIGLSTSRAPAEYKAFMVAYMKTPNYLRIRTKRTVKKRDTTYFDYDRYNPYRSLQGRYVPKTRSCERWALYVNFRDLGFEDWIIAPDGYAAFYCDGFCTFPLNAHMNATNHAIVQTLMHLMDPTSVPRPCCAPTELTPITVLYFDDNSNVILKRYKNMVVKTCGCQ